MTAKRAIVEDRERNNFLLQTTDHRCYDFFQRFYTSFQNKKELEEVLNKVIKNRENKEPYSQCSNKLLVSGNPIYMFSEKQLILYKEDDKIFCFDLNDVQELYRRKVNFYTEKTLSTEFLKVLETINNDKLLKQPIWPLNMALKYLFDKYPCFKEFSYAPNIGLVR